MLAAPGGLYLDVKSAYSTPQQLKWFGSTLAGIGVNVKVGVCGGVIAMCGAVRWVGGYARVMCDAGCVRG